MTFKNKLGWLLIFMFSSVNIYFAIINYLAACKGHEAVTYCYHKGHNGYRDASMWDHMSAGTHFHFGLVLVVSILLFWALVVWLVKKEENTTALAEAKVVKKEE